MKYTDILFDLDDTLLDTIGNARDTLHEIYEEYEVRRYYATYEGFAEVYFPHNNDLWDWYAQGKIDKPTLLRERFSYPFKDFADVTNGMIEAMNLDFLSRAKLKNKVIEGAIHVLEYLGTRYRMHILSNGFTEMQYVKMRSAGIDGYFDKIILSDAVGVNKPHPDIFRFALQEIGAKSENVVMIGDNFISDISGAKGAGVDQIWFNPEGKEATGFIPTHTIDRLGLLKDIL